MKRRLVDERGTCNEVTENSNKLPIECTCQEYTPCYIIMVWPHQRVCDRVITAGWAGGWDEMAMNEPTYRGARSTKFGRYAARPYFLLVPNFMTKFGSEDYEDKVA